MATWEEQDDIRNVATTWVTKANEENVERIHQESTLAAVMEDTPPVNDPIWQALADCPITLTMSKLLKLVPRFRQAMESYLYTSQITILVNFTKSTSGPAIIYHQNPKMKVLVQGTKIARCIVDSDFG